MTKIDIDQEIDKIIDDMVKGISIEKEEVDRRVNLIVEKL